MSRVTRVAATAALATALLPAAAAHAAPPANDAPAGATEYEPYTAPNGTPTERGATADLREATADAGVPRCLGDGSFERTVWYRVPAASGPRTIVVEATSAEGQGAETPDLAAFVQPESGGPVTSEPQSCDGPGAGGVATAGEGAAAVEVRVPANRSVLIQAGRSAGQADGGLQLALRATDAELLPSPAGDAAGDAAPGLAIDDRTVVALGGATVTEEDPAQPACPAPATVWRRATARTTGEHRVGVAGAAAGTLTVFVGARPSGDNAVACENRTAGGAAGIATTFAARAGDPLWLRIGTDAPSRDASAVLGLSGPGGPAVPGQPGGPGGTTGKGLRLSIALRGRSARKLARRQKVTLRLRVLNGSLARLDVRLQRRVGKRYRTVAVAKRTKLSTSTKPRTLRVKRLRGARGKLRPGVYRIRVRARTGETPAKTFLATKRYRLRR